MGYKSLKLSTIFQFTMLRFHSYIFPKDLICFLKYRIYVLKVKSYQTQKCQENIENLQCITGVKGQHRDGHATIKWWIQGLSFISFMILFNVAILPKDIQNIVSLRCSLQSRVTLLRNYWHCGLGDSFGGWGGDCARHCKMFSNTPGLYLLDAINIPTPN